MHLIFTGTLISSIIDKKIEKHASFEINVSGKTQLYNGGGGEVILKMSGSGGKKPQWIKILEKAN